MKFLLVALASMFLASPAMAYELCVRYSGNWVGAPTQNCDDNAVGGSSHTAPPTHCKHKA